MRSGAVGARHRRVVALLFPRSETRQCCASGADRQAKRRAGRGVRGDLPGRAAWFGELAGHCPDHIGAVLVAYRFERTLFRRSPVSSRARQMSKRLGKARLLVGVSSVRRGRQSRRVTPAGAGASSGSRISPSARRSTLLRLPARRSAALGFVLTSGVIRLERIRHDQIGHP